MQNITFSFDVGYASIGWAVVQAPAQPEQDPGIVACGTVLFPSDDCQAFQRRNYRRLRRNIRSRRVRIERIGKLLVQAGILTPEEKATPGHPAPFFLAAQAWQGIRQLSPLEVWHILRWYAHNRGYDNNAAWATVSTKEDTEKVNNARHLMQKFGAETMCATLCHAMELDMDVPDAAMTVSTPAYRTLNSAFPRDVVQREVLDILRHSASHIKELTPEIIRLIAQQEDLSTEQRSELAAKGIRLARRYRGSLLFGQLLPRFDNRIIRRCPIIWAHTFEQAKTSGMSEKEAQALADKVAKVPTADCPEFYAYRFARILNNLRANGLPLPVEVRCELMQAARAEGKLTAAKIKKEIMRLMGDVESNIDHYFHLHPDSEEALILDPAMECLHRTGLYDALSSVVRRVALTRLRRGKICTPAYLRDMMLRHGEDTQALDLAIAKQQGRKAPRPRKNDTDASADASIAWQDKPLAPKTASGRAPYARPVLRQAVDEIMNGEDPTRPALDEQHPDGEDKPSHGCLYGLLDPASKENEYLNKLPLDALTNNHLVRHRMLILDRLTQDLVREFADGDPSRVERFCIEVGRELSAFSGMTSKQIQSELNERMKHFKSAVAYLAKHAPDMATSAGLIRKCRIAMDMNWQCPFTGQTYMPYDLPKLEREHIVPYANRKTDALSALVLTWLAVNKMKGKRTAYQFIKECEGQSVPGRNQNIVSVKQYETFVEKLDTKGHADDAKRKKTRKKLMMVDRLSSQGTNGESELDFTEGMMTQSSHLMKIAARGVRKNFPHATVDMIPGAITGTVRKAWKVAGCLAGICPEAVDPVTHRIQDKETLRRLTHLHHALDACVLGLIPHLIPEHRSGLLRKALAARRLPENVRQEVESAVSKRYYTITKESKLELRDLPTTLKNSIAAKLSEGRVVQHIPADMSGAKLEETIWGIAPGQHIDDNSEVVIRQKSLSIGKDGNRIRTRKTDKQGNPITEKASKLVGIKPTGTSKLQPIRGVIIIKDNFAIALDPVPTMIPHHNVYKRLEELRKLNHGRHVRLLKKGMLIRLSHQKSGDKNGMWKVRSIQDQGSSGLKVNLQRPYYAGKIEDTRTENWKNVSIKALLSQGMEILPTTYCGTTP
ncbi:HNH endonuclease domain-containing protein [Akkermansia glycaniphila]|uniref:Hnh endonuclease n=1 Tax=Akkermansia glycaniphila TaxID=1679444 RepID=A0A1C7PAA2_9BACT|nr:HNH endonuclease domain-containing protein [Akkermansia glycaniphila]OCA02503.1 hypothetical protein AC781_09855 [Akkermansia glycaniphila]SEH89855.1 hnh endonuclease [Akkermansia glycaniphila]